MNLLIANNEELRLYIPNVVHEVEDEVLLYDKMLPFLENAQIEVERNFIGDLSLNEAEHRAACSLIAAKAMYHAAPSLDLVLTPNGFGVVNSTNIAPASKERVERLRASLLEVCDKWSDNLLFALRLNEAWLKSNMAETFSRTLLWNLDAATNFKKADEPLFDAYMRIQPFAVSFEQTVESDYLGPALMGRLHGCFPAPGSDLVDKQLYALLLQVKDAELRWIGVHHRDRSITCPKKHEIWHLMQRIVLKLRDYPALYEIWRAEVGDLFSVAHEDFFPNKKGGCWL